jgi:hypothetical protein
MAPNEIDTKAHDAMRRKRGAGVVAAIVFMVIFAVFVFRFEPWGLRWDGCPPPPRLRRAAGSPTVFRGLSTFLPFCWI